MKYRLFIAFLFIYSFSFSQTEVLFETIKTKTYILSYNSDVSESQRTINDIISMISDYTPKYLYNTKVNFRVDENIKITKQRNVVNIWVSYSNIRLDGDIIYKGFDISPALIPSKYEFSGTLWCEVDSAKTTFKQNNRPFNPAENEIAFNYTDTVRQNRYSFNMDNIHFMYDFDNKNRFGAHLQAIDTYYKADRDLNESHSKLSKMKTDNIDLYEINVTNINEISRLVREIESDPFWTILPINMYDPQKVRNKMFELKNILQDKQNELNRLKSVIHEKFFDKGYNEYQNKKLSDAKISFKKSLAYFPKYAKSQFFLAIIAYDLNNIDESESLLNEFYKFPNIDDETFNYSLNLVKNIENTRLNSAEAYILKEQFKEAITLLDGLKKFCSKIPKHTCNEDIDKLTTISHNGIYKNYLLNSKAAFGNGNHEKAIVDADRAINYQASNKQWIADSEDAIAFKKQIYADYYPVLINDGRKYYQEKKFQNAFAKFKTATYIEASWEVKKDKQLPELLKKSKLELLIVDANTSLKYVQSNNLPKAREILMQVMEDQKSYLLTDNKQLNEQIEELKKGIFKQECVNAQHDYDLKLELATKAETAKDFIKALQLYNEALVIVDKFPDCAIQKQVATDGNKRCIAPAKYQTDLKACKNTLQNLNFNKATVEYLSLSDFYVQNKIESFGIIHQSLFQFFQNFGTDFMRYGAEYFVNQGKLDNSLAMLKELMFKNDARSLTKKTQQMLAHEMANRDFKINPNVNFKLKIAEYTKESKYFKYFNKEYKKSIKKLR